MSETQTDTEPNRIQLPEHIRTKIQRRIRDTEFEDVDEYVCFVLEQVLTQREQDEIEQPVESVETSATVENRLESLGYL